MEIVVHFFHNNADKNNNKILVSSIKEKKILIIKLWFAENKDKIIGCFILIKGQI